MTPRDAGARAGLTDALQALVEDLAADLGRSVAVDDSDMRLIAASRHFGDEDPLRVRSILDRHPGRDAVEYAMSEGIALWSTWGRLAARPELGLQERICAPVRGNGLLLGYMWIIDADGSLDDDRLEGVQAVADACGALLYRRATMRDQERDTSAQLFRGLVGPSPKKRRRSVRAIDDLHLWEGGELLAVVLLAEHGDEGPSDEARAAIGLEIAVDRALRGLHGLPRLASVQGDRAGILIGAEGGADEAVQRLLRPVRARFREAAGAGARLVAGIGPVRRGLAEAHESHSDALLAARAGLRVSGLGDTVDAAQLGHLRVLLQLPDEAAAPQLVVPGWAALVERDADGTLRRTLRAFLDRAGNVQETAEALTVHRTTLYHRIARAEELLGLDLRRGDDRLSLHLALLLAELRG